MQNSKQHLLGGRPQADKIRVAKHRTLPRGGNHGSGIRVRTSVRAGSHVDVAHQASPAVTCSRTCWQVGRDCEAILRTSAVDTAIARSAARHARTIAQAGRRGTGDSHALIRSRRLGIVALLRAVEECQQVLAAELGTKGAARLPKAVKGVLPGELSGVDQMGLHV